MRLALAVLFVAATVTVASAQGTPNKAGTTESQEMLRQRLLLRERFNKGWDVQIEHAQDHTEAGCKAEAARRYSRIHIIKRRRFIRNCIGRR
jgi:hypothetical protein